MIFAWHIDNFNVELAQEFVPSSSSAHGADHLVEVLRVPVLEALVVAQNFDFEECDANQLLYFWRMSTIAYVSFSWMLHPNWPFPGYPPASC